MGDGIQVVNFFAIIFFRVALCSVQLVTTVGMLGAYSSVFLEAEEVDPLDRDPALYVPFISNPFSYNTIVCLGQVPDTLASYIGEFTY